MPVSCYETMGNFSENLRRIMSEKGINQVELEKRSGVKQQLISNYVNESKPSIFPNLTNLRKLAEALSCSADELIGREIPMKTPVVAEKALELDPETKEMLEDIRKISDKDKKKLLKKMIETLAEEEE